MPSPFPGMDPYLEAPGLGPDVHNSLIASIRDELSPRLFPRYYVALEERTYVEVEVPVPDRVRETYLEVRGVEDGEVVAVLEVLSHSNKRQGRGRRRYLHKRDSVLGTETHLVEVDLLRSGEGMPLVGARPSSDYSILVSRSWQRARAQLYPFGVRDPIPSFALPLRAREDEPRVELGPILKALYDRAGYSLRVDYRRPAEPPLREEDSAWAASLLAERGLAS